MRRGSRNSAARLDGEDEVKKAREALFWQRLTIGVGSVALGATGIGVVAANSAPVLDSIPALAAHVETATSHAVAAKKAMGTDRSGAEAAKDVDRDGTRKDLDKDLDKGTGTDKGGRTIAQADMDKRTDNDGHVVMVGRGTPTPKPPVMSPPPPPRPTPPPVRPSPSPSPVATTGGSTVG
jgi:hypothetical protein